MSAVIRRIVAIDDHVVSLRGLASILEGEADLELVGVFPSVSEFLASPLGTEQLDLAILDLRLADDSQPEDNVESLKSVTENVIVFSSLESPFLVRKALRSGVLGIVEKSADPDVIIDVIRQASSGVPVPSTEWASAIDSDPDLDSVHLTERQSEILELYASGRPAKQVARITGLSQDTINDYLGRIRTKYAAAGRPAPTKTDLFMRAQEDGYLPGPSDPVEN